MNYYEIFKDGLKIIIKTNVTNIDIKMDKYFNGCFIINYYNKENILNELVVIDIIDGKTINYFKTDCFVMTPNTYIFSNKKNRIKFIYDKFDSIYKDYNFDNDVIYWSL